MGVTRQVLKRGAGLLFPKKGDRVTMHYIGTVSDRREKPNGGCLLTARSLTPPVTAALHFQCRIGVGQVIRGWDEAVPEMSVGEVAKLTMTSDFAYGKRGVPGVIPEDATLVFEVELLAVN
ncbi:peptidyl-prolyl cis-trans isomerase [Basidiobolus meristosporus CBS 931.73]|uniref:peptidylprolyl isomerase n=1 Tax=Basidiobolus meristosporus CBS 931.73 TaxID=1314790 RepID=A0A1Y1YAU1_9FUNG|nr:peptidyl-prolyl cis-trans isomerase [Basidiobolus meristosporus CBS 931.73]|eukprot:ORX94734.1 peptidyl-prolyl cis-trans isomerase [Basidiobolus meristosporus CBS 931.73]